MALNFLHGHGPDVTVAVAEDRSALHVDLTSPQRVREFKDWIEHSLDAPEWARDLLPKLE